MKFSREPPELKPEAMAELVVEYERVLEALADAAFVGPNETPVNSAPGARLLHVLDVRERTETALGTISHAVLIPRAHSHCAASEHLSVLSLSSSIIEHQRIMVDISYSTVYYR